MDKADPYKASVEDMWPAHHTGQEQFPWAAGGLCDAEQAEWNHVQMPPQTTIHIGTGKTTIAKEGGSLGAPHPRKFFIKLNQIKISIQFKS